jgi:hypothetical protein
MSRYTQFKLYWEDWTGYPDQSHPWAEPTLVWIVATRETASRCLVDRQAKDNKVIWNANWQALPYSKVRELVRLLHEVGVFDKPKQLVEDSGDGDYLSVWDLTGVLDDRVFHMSLSFRSPGHKWNTLGQQLKNALFETRK